MLMCSETRNRFFGGEEAMLVSKAAIVVEASVNVLRAVHWKVILTAEAVDRIRVVATGRTLHPQA
jgi:hypothetical protein